MPIDAEPYVRDPAEPRLPAAWSRLRPLVAALVVVVLLGAVAYVVYDGRARQDPALDSPVEQQDDG